MATEFLRQRWLRPREDGSNSTETCLGNNTITIQVTLTCTCWQKSIHKAVFSNFLSEKSLKIWSRWETINEKFHSLRGLGCKYNTFCSKITNLQPKARCVTETSGSALRRKLFSSLLTMAYADPGDRLPELRVRIPAGAYMSVVCCQLEVSAMGRSLVQRSPTDCGVSLRVIYKPQECGSPGPRLDCCPERETDKVIHRLDNCQRIS
jgi:hypothetical protein